MERVLEGVKVLEVSAWAFVPSAGAVLADWGADVVKIEPPTGDPIRGLVNAGIGGGSGPSFPWEAWNRGKRSVALDLKHPRARGDPPEGRRDGRRVPDELPPPDEASARASISTTSVRSTHPSCMRAAPARVLWARRPKRAATTPSASGPAVAWAPRSPHRAQNDRSDNPRCVRRLVEWHGTRRRCGRRPVPPGPYRRGSGRGRGAVGNGDVVPADAHRRCGRHDGAAAGGRRRTECPGVSTHRSSTLW